MNQICNVLLTGAAGGIGRAIAKSLIGEGHSVVLSDRHREPLEALARELGERAFPLVLDITDPIASAAILDSVPQDFSPIDMMINNAGHHVGGGVNFAEGAIDDWASIVETNLVGPMRITRAILPGMIERNRGHIVNISSISGLRIVATMAPYSAAKAGVHMLSDILRAEVASTDIRITEINPGLTKTNIQLERFKGDEAKAKAYYDRCRMTLAPEDIARSVLFAVSQPEHVQIAQMVILPTDRF
jgi:3-hydroxy acid dehydrogenase/malonic semialdehyde reductase